MELNEKGTPYELHTVNGLWVQEGFELNDDYVNMARTAYNSSVANVNFEAPEGIDTINRWVSNQTNNKIPQLFPPGPRPEAVFAITNAVYFKATWYYEFDKQLTKAADFRVDNDTTIKAQMMYVSSVLRYGESHELQILELPYKGERISMLILLPTNDDLDAVDQMLSPAKLSEWKEIMELQPVDARIPRFTLETDYDLKESLTELGVVTPFSEKADFSGITPRRVQIGEAVHKAFVEVNEEGTEAAAATGVIGVLTGGLQPARKHFNADHPFVFIIQDNVTGNILFIGKVVNPSVS